LAPGNTQRRILPVSHLHCHDGMSLEQIGWLAAVYPAVWGIGQLFTGAWSDTAGRKWLIVAGMFTQAVGIGLTAVAGQFWGFAAGAALMGAGTAMVYPTLLAAIGDVAHPSWRASSVGIYRLWRDSGYATGALVAGVVADSPGLTWALWLIAGLTAASGLLVAIRMRETLRKERAEADAEAPEANTPSRRTPVLPDVSRSTRFATSSPTARTSWWFFHAGAMCSGH
jgi:MFS family permease